jgi:hypothetical protein
VLYYGASKAVDGYLWWLNFAFFLPNKDRQGERERKARGRRDERRQYYKIS